MGLPQAISTFIQALNDKQIFKRIFELLIQISESQDVYLNNI